VVYGYLSFSKNPEALKHSLKQVAEFMGYGGVFVFSTSNWCLWLSKEPDLFICTIKTTPLEALSSYRNTCWIPFFCFSYSRIKKLSALLVHSNLFSVL
jgi:hypothetical protein